MKTLVVLSTDHEGATTAIGRMMTYWASHVETGAANEREGTKGRGERWNQICFGSPVYLPDSPDWYDFWTGASVQGSREFQADAPLDRMPLYIRAGSILPLGPEIEYAEQKPEDPIELRIYPGADGRFQLYGDEGDNYDYEKSEHSLIPITWSQANKTLFIGARVGSYPGMPSSITFHIVWVREGHGTGESVESSPDRVIEYTGSALTIRQP